MWEREQGHCLNQITKMWVTLEQSKKDKKLGDVQILVISRDTENSWKWSVRSKRNIKKWESSKKIKSLEKKRLCFHGVSSTWWGLCVMGQKKCGMSSSFWSGSKPLILDRVGFVRAVTGLEYGPWTTLRHAQSSAKCEKLTYLYSSPKKNCCVTTLQEFRPNWVGKSKSIFKIVFHFQSITLYSRNTGTSHFYIFTRNLLAPDYNKAFSFCLKAGLIKKPTKQKPSENWIAPKLWYREGFLSF